MENCLQCAHKLQLFPINAVSASKSPFRRFLYYKCEFCNELPQEIETVFTYIEVYIYMMVYVLYRYLYGDIYKAAFISFVLTFYTQLNIECKILTGYWMKHFCCDICQRLFIYLHANAAHNVCTMSTELTFQDKTLMSHKKGGCPQFLKYVVY